VTVYRGRVRLAIQSIGSGLAATLFAATTVLAWGQWLPTLASAAAMSVFAALTVRIPCTRIEADAAGITVHTITGNAFYSWDAITLIGVLHDQADIGLLAVYTPTARLIDGRDVHLTPVGCYRRAMAATIGAMLDAQRRHQLEAAYKQSYQGRIGLNYS
jgi:hypothetical protein